MPQAIAEDVAADKLELTELPVHSEADIHAALAPIVEESLAKIRARRKRREDFIAAHGGEKQGPWVYLIVATGNIYEDVVQGHRRRPPGADVIAVINKAAAPVGESLIMVSFSKGCSRRSRRPTAASSMGRGFTSS